MLERRFRRQSERLRRLLSGYACSDLPLGRRVIAAVNRIIADAGERPPWADYYLEWLGDAARVRYEQLLAEHNPWRRPAPTAQ